MPCWFTEYINTRYGFTIAQYFISETELNSDISYRLYASAHKPKKSIEFNSVKNIQHKLDNVFLTYWNSGCRVCALKDQCTPSTERRVRRWEHEAVLDAMQVRLNNMPEAMLIRKQTVEHPFGTLKAWMGATHFQMKSLDHVSTEMSLHVLACNLKRVMKILGIGPLMQAMRA